MPRRPLRLASMMIPADQVRLLPPSRGSGARRYGILLLILVVTYLLSAFTVGGLVSAVQVLLFLAVVLIALRNGRLRRRTARLVGVGLLLGSVAAAIIRVVDDTGDSAALASLWTAMILLLAVVLIVRQVLAQPEITLQSIFGVLSAYMMIGLIFSAVYVAMWRFSGHPFFVNGAANDTKTFQYFSFTTLTTLGYGDFTAAGDGGRAVAVLEAMAGQMFLATLVARLVAGFRWSDRGAGRRVRPAGHQGGQGNGSGAEAGADPGPGPAGTHPGAAAEPGPTRSAHGVPGAGRSLTRKASAPGLIQLSPPGTVRGRGTGLRRGGRNGAGGAGPAPAARPPGGH
jgi:hypothetical protein